MISESASSNRTVLCLEWLVCKLFEGLCRQGDIVGAPGEDRRWQQGIHPSKGDLSWGGAWCMDLFGECDMKALVSRIGCVRGIGEESDSMGIGWIVGSWIRRKDMLE